MGLGGEGKGILKPQVPHSLRARGIRAGARGSQHMARMEITGTWILLLLSATTDHHFRILIQQNQQQLHTLSFFLLYYKGFPFRATPNPNHHQTEALTMSG